MTRPEALSQLKAAAAELMVNAALLLEIEEVYGEKSLRLESELQTALLEIEEAKEALGQTYTCPEIEAMQEQIEGLNIR